MNFSNQEEEEYEDKEIFLFLDFAGSIEPTLLNRSDVFFKITGLEKTNPLVQIGDFVFEGTYENSLGTNLFFEEDLNRPEKDNIFIRDTPISLKYLGQSANVLSLKYVELPAVSVAPAEPVVLKDFECNNSVDTLLEKLTKGCLKLEDLNLHEGKNSEEEQKVEEIIQTTPNLEIDIPSNENKEFVRKKTHLSSSVKLSKSEVLTKFMTRERLKRQSTHENVSIPKELRMNYEYYNLKNKLMQCTPVFQKISLEYDKNTLEGAVDVARSARQGLINEEGGIPRVLTLEEKEKLLTLDNYENLSVPMRYCVLRKMMKKRKRLIKSSSIRKLQKIDKEYGVTIMEVYKLFKAVCCDLKRFILANSEQIDEQKLDNHMEDVEDVEKMDVS